MGWPSLGVTAVQISSLSGDCCTTDRTVLRCQTRIRTPTSWFRARCASVYTIRHWRKVKELNLQPPRLARCSRPVGRPPPATFRIHARGSDPPAPPKAANPQTSITPARRAGNGARPISEDPPAGAIPLRRQRRLTPDIHHSGTLSREAAGGGRPPSQTTVDLMGFEPTCICLQGRCLS